MERFHLICSQDILNFTTKGDKKKEEGENETKSENQKEEEAL